MNIDGFSRFEENIEIVQQFRGFLECQLMSMKQQPISNSVRNNVMIKLMRLKNTTKKLRVELNGIRALVDKSRLEVASGFCSSKVEDKEQSKVVCNKENERGEGDLNRIVVQKKEYKPQQKRAEIEKRHSSPVRDCKPTDLRAQIYKQLEEIRNLQHRQKVVRNLNESRQRSVSQMKKKVETLQQIPSKQTQSVIHYEDKKIVKISSSTTFQTEYSEEDNYKDIKQVDDIAVNVPMRPSSTTLTCSNKHEYYVGSAVGKVPQGHGRLYNCCSAMPLSVPESVEFYTGGFSKGKFEGYGTLTTKEGVKFVGSFKDGLKHGQGSLFYRGKVEIARWANDKFLSNI